VLSVRPKVAELAFHLFGRSLHPELIDVHQRRLVRREAYDAKVEITNCGHVVTFNAHTDLGDQTDLGEEAGVGGEADVSDGSIVNPESPKDGANPVTLCEVATSVHQPLPARRSLLRQTLKGSRTENVSCRRGVSYRTHFQLETVDPKLFWMVGQQLGKGPTEGLLHWFDSSGRMAMGALSYVNIETRRHSMLVQAIHTFPDDYAIVKVESLFMTSPESTGSGPAS